MLHAIRLCKKNRLSSEFSIFSNNKIFVKNKLKLFIEAQTERTLIYIISIFLAARFMLFCVDMVPKKDKFDKKKSFLMASKNFK